MAKRPKIHPAIKPGATFKTRGGSKARIYAIDAGGDYPVHGAMFEHRRWWLMTWTANGRDYSNAESPVDLILPAILRKKKAPKTKRRDG